MNRAMLIIGIIMLAMFTFGVINITSNYQSGNELDYYLLKETTEAAMIDSIDISYYRETGELKIVREKFVENFTRRFAESTLIIGSKYTIKFFDIMFCFGSYFSLERERSIICYCFIIIDSNNSHYLYSSYLFHISTIAFSSASPLP